MPFFFPAGASNFEKHFILQGLGKECPVMAMPQLSLYIKAVQQISFASFSRVSGCNPKPN